MFRVARQQYQAWKTSCFRNDVFRVLPLHQEKQPFCWREGCFSDGRGKSYWNWLSNFTVATNLRNPTYIYNDILRNNILKKWYFWHFLWFFFKYHFSKCLPKVWLFNNISTIDKGTEPLDIICYHIWTLHLLRAVFIIDHSYRFYIHFCLYLFFLLWTLYIVTNWTKCCFWNLKSVVFSCLLSLFFWCSHLFCTIWNTHNSPETIRLWQ